MVVGRAGRRAKFKRVIKFASKQSIASGNSLLMIEVSRGFDVQLLP